MSILSSIFSFLYHATAEMVRLYLSLAGGALLAILAFTPFFLGMAWSSAYWLDMTILSVGLVVSIGCGGAYGWDAWKNWYCD